MFPFREKKLNLDEKWFNSLKKDLEESYLRYPEPWKQAGFLLSEDTWETCRRPIVQCIQKSGAFLDIGCANGYLLESILKWSSFDITPYGLDLSTKLIDLAKARLPKYASNLFQGSAPYWTSPIKFDYVRTDLGYALEDAQEQYLHKVFSTYLAPEGRLLVTEYRTKKEPPKTPWLNEKIKRWEFNILDQKSGFYEGKELTRVLVITRNV
jgi:ubiquinone/menaquinone biosynthesis C-methylase UbiE